MGLNVALSDLLKFLSKILLIIFLHMFFPKLYSIIYPAFCDGSFPKPKSM